MLLTTINHVFNHVFNHVPIWNMSAFSRRLTRLLQPSGGESADEGAERSRPVEERVLMNEQTAAGPWRREC